MVAFTWLHSLGFIHLVAFTWFHSLGYIPLVAFTRMHSLGFIHLVAYTLLQSHWLKYWYINLLAIPCLYSLFCHSFMNLSRGTLFPCFQKKVVKIDVRPSLEQEGYMIITKIIFEKDLRSFRLLLSFETPLYFTLYLMIEKEVNIVK